LFSFLFVVVVPIALLVAGPSDERSSDANADADAEVVPSDGYGGIVKVLTITFPEWTRFLSFTPSRESDTLDTPTHPAHPHSNENPVS
jgi:hypothetical protein